MYEEETANFLFVIVSIIIIINIQRLNEWKYAQTESNYHNLFRAQDTHGQQNRMPLYCLSLWLNDLLKCLNISDALTSHWLLFIAC